MRWTCSVFVLATLACGKSAPEKEPGASAPDTAAAADATPEPPPRPDAAPPAPAYIAPDYDDLTTWLCHPELPESPCRGDLNAAIIKPDGEVVSASFEGAGDAATFDCLYVYPTVSRDPGENSDLAPSDFERVTAYRQIARFRSVCPVYAPLYRQVTRGAAAVGKGDWVLAFKDVQAAFAHYLSKSDGGRPFLLVGQSQGALLLTQLVASMKPEVRRRMVAAYLPGANFEVAEGREVGGSLADVRTCRHEADTRCIVAYSTFRADAPPKPDVPPVSATWKAAGAMFGRASVPERQVACVNPAAIGGGAAPLQSYFLTDAKGDFAVLSASPWADPSTARPAMPFFTMPGMVRGECVETDGYRYLAVTVTPDAKGKRAKDVPTGPTIPGFGTHAVDIQLLQGDLIQLAQKQAAAWHAEYRAPVKEPPEPAKE